MDSHIRPVAAGSGFGGLSLVIGNGRHGGIAAMLCAILLVAAADAAAAVREQPTQNGLYRITIVALETPVPISALHSWRVKAATADGDTFVPTRLAFYAGMPAHGHGMVSEPVVAERLDDDSVRIDGVRFHMAGEWQLIVGVVGPGGPDKAVFDLRIGSPPSTGSFDQSGWSDAELEIMRSLSLASLRPPPKDPSNRFSGNDIAARFGERLFFDAGLSGTGQISCAHCHDPDKKFTDGLAKSRGSRPTARNAPSVIASSYGRWYYWDGRRDSLWAQAITPIETVGEMDSTRVDAVRHVLLAADYADLVARLYEVPADVRDQQRFPPGAGPYAAGAGRVAWEKMSVADRELVNRLYADIGKILAAYMETLQHRPSRFDRFVEALSVGGQDRADGILTEDERGGLKLFMDSGRTQCLRCHNGPLFTNHGFHNIGTGTDAVGALDFGRAIGLRAVQIDEFNCRGRYNDDADAACAELRFVAPDHLERGSFKTPSLRNVSQTAPYLHDGRFADLESLIEHYRSPPDSQSEPHELPPLELSDTEASQLIAFLGALTDGGADR